MSRFQSFKLKEESGHKHYLAQVIRVDGRALGRASDMTIHVKPNEFIGTLQQNGGYYELAKEKETNAELLVFTPWHSISGVIFKEVVGVQAQEGELSSGKAA